jgi:KTSC domain
MDAVKTHSESSNIATIEHHPALEKLIVEFRNGGRYEYDGFTAEDHQAFISAESHGKHFHARIKGKFNFRKLTN